MDVFRSRAMGCLEGLACLALLAMMLLVTGDVAGRYLLGRPLAGAIELVQYTMVVVVFAGLPAVTVRRRHISLGLLDGHLSGRAKRVHWILLCLGSTTVLATQSWLLFNRAQTMRENQDVIGFLNLPVHPAAYFMSALSLLSAIIVLVASTGPAPEAGDYVH